MMKKISLLACLACLCIQCFSQQLNQKTTGNGSIARDTAIRTDIRDRLIELTLQNPAYKIATYERDKTVYELNKAGAAWLNYVVASININEISIGSYNHNDVNKNNLYYPLWNIGINVPLGSLVGKPNDVKIARANLKITTEQQQALAQQLKAEVLARYEDYVSKRELLQLQNDITDDNYNDYSQAEAKYSAGSITYEEYSVSAKRYNTEQINKMNLERDVKVTKIRVEEMIGRKLEEIYQDRPTTK
ncbi:MAG TPA: TolC family protein [Chitinophaga sp.]